MSKDIPPDPTEKCVTRSSRYICTQQTEDNTTYEQILLLTFLPRPRHNLPLPSICPMDPPEQLDWRIEGNSTVHYVSTRDGTIYPPAGWRGILGGVHYPQNIGIVHEEKRTGSKVLLLYNMSIWYVFHFFKDEKPFEKECTVSPENLHKSMESAKTFLFAKICISIRRIFCKPQIGVSNLDYCTF